MTPPETQGDLILELNADMQEVPIEQLVASPRFAELKAMHPGASK